MLAKNSYLKNDIVALQWSACSVHLDVYSTSNLYTESHQHHSQVRRFIGAENGWVGRGGEGGGGGMVCVRCRDSYWEGGGEGGGGGAKCAFGLVK